VLSATITHTAAPLLSPPTSESTALTSLSTPSALIRGEMKNCANLRAHTNTPAHVSHTGVRPCWSPSATRQRCKRKGCAALSNTSSARPSHTRMPGHSDCQPTCQVPLAVHPSCSQTVSKWGGQGTHQWVRRKAGTEDAPVAAGRQATSCRNAQCVVVCNVLFVRAFVACTLSVWCSLTW
jgi:hypothetical protein